MRKTFAVLCTFVFLLISCASPTPAPMATVTAMPTITLTVAPTFTPTATATATPKAVPVAPDPMTGDLYNFTAEQVAGYDKIEQTTWNLNGQKDVPVILGVKGEERTVLAMEVVNWRGERVMQRVSVVSDPDTGVEYSVFVNSDFDAGDETNPARVMIATDGAQEIFFGKYGLFSRFSLAAPNGGKYGALGIAGLRELIADQLGTGIEMDTLMQPAEPPAGDTAAMEWGVLPRPVDWGKPLELVFVAAPEQFAQLPADVQAKFVIERDPGMDQGVLFWVGEDGHPQIFVASRDFMRFYGNQLNVSHQEEATEQQFANEVLRTLWIFGRERDESRNKYALNDAHSKLSSREMKPLSETAFDVQIR